MRPLVHQDLRQHFGDQREGSRALAGQGQELSVPQAQAPWSHGSWMLCLNLCQNPGEKRYGGERVYFLCHMAD